MLMLLSMVITAVSGSKPGRSGLKALQPDRPLPIPDHALLNGSAPGRHHTPKCRLGHRRYVLQKLRRIEEVGEEEIDLVAVGVAVKFDHLVSRHQLQRVGQPHIDPVVVPVFAPEHLQIIVVLLPGLEFHPGALFLGCHLIFGRLFMGDEIKIDPFSGRPPRAATPCAKIRYAKHCSGQRPM
jgi:hypothetical protein